MTTKKELDKFAKETIPILEKYGYLNKNYNFVKMIIFFLLGIIFTGVFLYGIGIGAFKSDISQNVTLEPETNVFNQFDSPETYNNYTFNPNFTIINNVVCPQE